MSAEHQVICKKLGSVMRQESDRVMSMFMTQDGHYIACHVSLFAFNNVFLLVKQTNLKFSSREIVGLSKFSKFVLTRR